MAVAPTVTDFTSDAIRTDVRAIGTEEMVTVTIPVTVTVPVVPEDVTAAEESVTVKG